MTNAQIFWHVTYFVILILLIVIVRQTTSRYEVSAYWFPLGAQIGLGVLYFVLVYLGSANNWINNL